MDVWANLRCKRNHIIVQSDRHRGGLKMSSILYLHQKAYRIHTTQCQINSLDVQMFTLCERPTTSPPKEPHSKYTTKILLHHKTSGLPDATPLGLERAALVLLIVSIQNKKHDILSYLINPERAVRFVNINVWRKRKGRRRQSYSYIIR